MRYIWVGILCFSGVVPLGALSPMDSYNSLVAGGDDAGFRDGGFVSARFDRPSGMALDGKGTRLFVADPGNNRIRAVHLDEQNKVETLAGSGSAGKADGPLAQASFDRPTLVAALPSDRLAVYDSGNGLLRWLDLKTGIVSTASEAPQGPVWDLVYRSQDDSLYFTEPTAHLLQKMDVKTGKIGTVLSNDPKILSPRALCLEGDRLDVSDATTSAIFKLKIGPGPVPGVEDVGKGSGVLRLGFSDGRLYALQEGNQPFVQVAPFYRPVSLATPWGFCLESGNPGYGPLLSFAGDRGGWFIPAPGEARRFLMTGQSSYGHAILKVRDDEYDRYWTVGTVQAPDPRGNVTDFNYPTEKNDHTFRILVVGDSRVVMGSSYSPGGKEDPNVLIYKSPRTNTFSKQLETYLNLRASLQGSGEHFEVLCLGHAGQPTWLFPYYEVPGVVKNYHIDLVMIFESPLSFDGPLFYFMRSPDDQGIPSQVQDQEYLLKPAKEKIPPGEPARFFQLCSEKKLVREASATQFYFEPLGTLLRDGGPELTGSLTNLMGKPLGLLGKKLGAMGKDGSGQGPRFMICFTGGPDTDAAQLKDYQDLWRGIGQAQGIPFLDLSDDFNVLQNGFYPTNDQCCHKHFNLYGNLLVSLLLGQRLVFDHWVPLEATDVPGAVSRTFSPLNSYHSLVAGGEDRGFQDGDFFKARFDQPRGLALDSRGSRLFVADENNHRIRVIHLDQKNRVETLCGTGLKGGQDGPLSSATFDAPRLLAWIPPDSLAVYEEGSHHLRRVDLTGGTVSTVTCDKPDCRSPLTLGQAWAMVYRAQEQSLYVSEPYDGILRRVDLKTQAVTMVLFGDAHIPHPKALCVDQEHLYVADRDRPGVFEWKGVDPSSQGVSWAQVGQGEQIQELAASKRGLFALQTGKTSLAQILPRYRPVSMVTPWGFFIEPDNPNVDPFIGFGGMTPTGFLASPDDPTNFLISGDVGRPYITNIKDREFDSRWTAGSIVDKNDIFPDFNYPAAKPLRTFRILVVGDSRAVFAMTPDPLEVTQKPGYSLDAHILASPRVLSFPKQLEFLLNTQASLSGVDTRFEVLTLARPGQSTPFFMPFDVPAAVQKYGVDLVMVLAAPQEAEGFVYYYERPLDHDGIPVSQVDPEYALKPYRDRIPDGVARDLYDRCQKNGWAREASTTRLTFSSFGDLLGSGDAGVRKDLLELTAKPFRVLGDKLAGTKGADGKAPQYLLCYVPGQDHGGATEEAHETFWKDLADKEHWPVLDLTEPFDALKVSFYPVNENCCHFHYTAFGHSLIAALLQHYLVGQGRVPFSFKGPEK